MGARAQTSTGGSHSTTSIRIGVWKSSTEQGAEHFHQRAGHASIRSLEHGPELPNNQFSVQSLEPHSVQQQNETMAMFSGGYQSQLPEGNPRQPTAKALGPVALEQWKRHFLNDHLPSYCSHCIRAQARSKLHRRVQHPDAFTLSVDLSGKLTPGEDQQTKGCKYLLVGCYMYSVTREGPSLVQVPGQHDEDADQPFPGQHDEDADQPFPGLDVEMPDEEE